MNQKRIIRLLRIAAGNPNMIAKCRDVLDDALSESLQSMGGIGMSILALYIYDEIAERHPGRLPELFPIFAALCGEGERSDRDARFAKVDWSIVTA